VNGWWWIPLGLLFLSGGCLFLFWAAARVGGRAEPFDDMVDVVAEHRPDCACEPCWDRYCERLVDQFDWPAAEHDMAWRRP
jgi:hypothetical protein